MISLSTCVVVTVVFRFKDWYDTNKTGGAIQPLNSSHGWSLGYPFVSFFHGPVYCGVELKPPSSVQLEEKRGGRRSQTPQPMRASAFIQLVGNRPIDSNQTISCECPQFEVRTNNQTCYYCSYRVCIRCDSLYCNEQAAQRHTVSSSTCTHTSLLDYSVLY